jgi:hypothetical protein
LFSAGMAILVLPLLAEPPADSWAPAVFHFSCLVIFVSAVVMPFNFLESVAASAAASKVQFIRGSCNAVLATLHSVANSLTSFLAGPVLIAGVGWLYWLSWMYFGDPSAVDWVILAELEVVGVAYWLYTLLAVSDRGQLRDLNPLAVADLAHRLSWGGLAVVLAAAVALLAHCVVLLTAADKLPSAALHGGAILAAASFSGVFWSTFFGRWLVVRCSHRDRPAPARRGANTQQQSTFP